MSCRTGALRGQRSLRDLCRALRGPPVGRHRIFLSDRIKPYLFTRGDEAMGQPALSADEVMAWLDATSTKWKALIEEHPEILNFPCDVMGVGTVGGLLQHIVAVELRYADQLSGLPPTDYAAIPFDSAAAIYATHDRAMTMYRELLA